MQRLPYRLAGSYACLSGPIDSVTGCAHLLRMISVAAFHLKLPREETDVAGV